MTRSSPYQAVSCAMHSELELAIMHGKYLMVHYVKTNNKGIQSDELIIKLKPRDVITRGHEEKGEFLVGSDDSGKSIEIRLDNINRFFIL